MNGQQPQQVMMMRFNCSVCQGPMEVPQPILRVFNAPEMSMIAFEHARVRKCPGCGTAYVSILHPQGVDQEGKIMIMWTPLQTKESAIVPGTEGNMKQAMQAKEIGDKIK